MTRCRLWRPRRPQEPGRRAALLRRPQRRRDRRGATRLARNRDARLAPRQGLAASRALAGRARHDRGPLAADRAALQRRWNARPPTATRSSTRPAPDDGSAAGGPVVTGPLWAGGGRVPGASRARGGGDGRWHEMPAGRSPVNRLRATRSCRSSGGRHGRRLSRARHQARARGRAQGAAERSSPPTRVSRRFEARGAAASA